jgi:hypothetical protein
MLLAVGGLVTDDRVKADVFNALKNVGLYEGAPLLEFSNDTLYLSSFAAPVCSSATDILLHH